MPNPQTLTALLWQQHRTALVLTIALNLANALAGIGVLAFINTVLLAKPMSVLIAGTFVLLIGLLFVLSFVSQYGLTVLGHRFVANLRLQLIKQILDTPFFQHETLGKSRLLASLSVDIQTITVGFVRLPELAQGVVVCLFCVGYLLYLSPVLGMIVLGWLGLTVVISTHLVKQVYAHLEKLRNLNDTLYAQYEEVLDGAAALQLNRHRAKTIFDAITTTSDTHKRHIIKADTFHLSALNVSNIMSFCGIGLVLIVAGFGVADKAVALSACFVMLFMQSPLLKAVGAYPVLQTAKVSFDKMMSLNLSPTQQGFDEQSAIALQRLDLKDINYQYANGQFAICNINLTLNQGEIVFLVGENGSGKTTLAKVLLGLYSPTSGQILYNEQAINADNLSVYRQAFGAIFSENKVFSHILGENGGMPDDELIDKWLNLLKLNNKISIDNHTLSTTKLSQGQKKRLALLLAICENKPILLLDEWAADQDPEYRKFFYDEILPMLKNMGKTLFVISHDDRFFDRADRVLLMKNGQLSTINTPNANQQ